MHLILQSVSAVESEHNVTLMYDLYYFYLLIKTEGRALSLFLY